MKTSIQSLLGYAASLARAIIPKTIRGSWLYGFTRYLIVPFDRVYDHNYYVAAVDKEATAGASVMAKSIIDCFKPKSVIDVGCGTGALLAAFRDCGCEIAGLENAKAGIAFCEKRGLPVRQFNIERDRFVETSKFDVVTSFEVAEHLPAWCANRYVDLLCQLAPIVVMSAATPGQGGTDHINERPHAYWIKKLAIRGYLLDKVASNNFAEQWHESGLASFYFENVMVFRYQRLLEPIAKVGTGD